MWPMLIGAGISAAGSIGSALLNKGGGQQSSSSSINPFAMNMSLIQSIMAMNELNQAREAGEKAFDSGIDELKGARTNALAYYSPYRTTGESANALLQRYLAGDSTAFQASPDYQFRFGEGQRALEASSAARGGLFSGAAGKALSDYGQQSASQEYGNWFNRVNSLGNMGLQAASGMAGVEQNTGNALASLWQNRAGFRLNGAQSANALRSPYIQPYAGGTSYQGMQSGNSLSDGFAGVSNAITGGIKNYVGYQQYQDSQDLQKQMLGLLGGKTSSANAGYSVPANMSSYGGLTNALAALRGN